VVTVWWHVFGRSRAFRFPKFQVNRATVSRRSIGVYIYGGLLGIGLLTLVSTPAVFVGALAVFLAGSAQLGAAFGISFGVGRTVSLAAAALPRAANQIEAGDRVYRYQMPAARYIALFGAVPAMLVLGLR
jgi:hypothetical protein